MSALAFGAGMLVGGAAVYAWHKHAEKKKAQTKAGG